MWVGVDVGCGGSGFQSCKVGSGPGGGGRIFEVRPGPSGLAGQGIGWISMELAEVQGVRCWHWQLATLQLALIGTAAKLETDWQLDWKLEQETGTWGESGA